MRKIRIIFDGKYYEYLDKELYPDIYYDLTDDDMVNLFNERREIIKNIDTCVSVLNKNLGNEDKAMYLTGSIIKDFEKLYELEKDISILIDKKNISLEWYQETNPINSDDIVIPEDQYKYICKQCGNIFDNDTIFDFDCREEKEISDHVCPNCHQDDAIFLENIHFYKARMINKELTYTDDPNKKMQLFDNALEELQLVNDFDEDDVKKVMIEIPMVHQRKARFLLSQYEIAAAYDAINIAIAGWEQAKEENALHSLDYNVLAMGYIVRETCCLELKKPDMLITVLSDGELVEACLNRYYASNQQRCKEEDDMNYLEGVIQEYQAISMMNYINIKNAVMALGNSHEEINKHIQKAMNFLSSCDRLEEEEKRNFHEKIRPLTFTSNNTSKQKEGCYIATAVYGDYEAPSVLVLRDFRDKRLKKTMLGRLFIKFYYSVSPSLANKLKTTKKINSYVKGILDYFVFYLKRNMQ